jgi:predicted ATPase/DNA-binding XRE family transcriptional regulator
MVEIYSFGYLVLRRRKALDLTREELARQVGCASETIKKIERDERRPSRQIAELLADALAVSPEEREHFLLSARGERTVEGLQPLSQPQKPLPSPHNLPHHPTPFLGRANELTKIDKLLADPNCRLLTIVGPGGVGKSRITLRAARNQVGLYRHGVYLVPLAGVEATDALPSVIMDALGLRSKGRVRSQLVHHLRDMDRELLLVLDNFEHLLESTDLLIEILQNTRRVKFLVSSRERLHVQSEWVLPIGGLPFPTMEIAEQIDDYASVKLFVQTARRLHADFVLEQIEKPFVARICQLVEGLPLAIELAASWIRVLSCQDIVRELEAGMNILNTTERDVPARHRNIRLVFDQSWKFLSEEERRVLAKLSVFRGGFTREAAEQVANASLLVLSALVDKSLIRVNRGPDEVQRYDLHELVRQYAYERLGEVGEAEVKEGRERHLAAFLGLAEQAAPELHRADNLLWVNRLDQDYDNLRAAFRWATDPARSGSSEPLQRLVGALWWFWCLRGHVEEACYWAECALSQAAPRDAIRAKALWVSGFLNFYYGNQDKAHDLLEQGVELCRQLGSSSKKDLALALNFLGLETKTRGDLATAQACYEESLSIRRELDDSWGIAQSLMNLGYNASDRGEFDRAQEFLEEGLLASRTLGERSHVAALLNALGWVVAKQDDLKRARSLLYESVTLCRELRWQWNAAVTFENLAILEARQASADQMKKAARLWGFAEMLFRVWGSTYQFEDSHQEIAIGREQLGEEAFSAAWVEGGELSFDEAIAYAFESNVDAQRSPDG